jgi:hypothetical protein
MEIASMTLFFIGCTVLPARILKPLRFIVTYLAILPFCESAIQFRD